MQTHEDPSGYMHRQSTGLDTTETPRDISQEQLTQIYLLTSKLSRALALPQIYEAALSCLQNTLSADRASVLVRDDSGVMRFTSWRGLSEDYRRAVDGHSPWAKDDKDPKPIVVADVLEEPSLRDYRDVVTTEGIRALAFIPLIYGTQLLGKFMVYFDRPHAFTEQEIHISQTIANHIAFAIERCRAEEKLRLYREIFAHSSEAIAIVSPSGEYLEQNAAHESLIGYSNREIVGKTPAVHLGELVFSHIAHELRECGNYRGEVTSTTKTGKRLDIEVAAFAVRDDQGVPMCFVKRDITERKRAEASLRFLADASAVLDGSLDYDTTLTRLTQLVVPTLADFCIIDVVEDGEIRRAVAVHKDPALSEHVERFRTVSVPDWNSPQPAAVVLRNGRPLMFEHIDDETVAEHSKEAEAAKLLRELKVSSAMFLPLRARGSILGAISFVLCDTERQYDEADLNLAADLARRAAMCLDNARLYRQSQESDRRKDEFLAMLAHELRNPLAPIVTALQLMGLRGRDPASNERALQVMERQVHHMVKLIDDLLDVSRITRGKIELRRQLIDVHAIVARAIETIKPLMDSRNHTLTISLPPRVELHVDPLRLEQVLANLLNNAAKYTEPGGKIDLTAAVEGHELILTVRDNGVGIPADMLQKVFDLFMQGERTLDRSLGGLGIGLTLVRSLVELHGGSVQALSAGLQQGSEFVVRLPLPAVNNAQEAIGSNGEASRGGLVRATAARRVLVVDDNVDAATTLAMALETSGHHVHTAFDGAMAISMARLHAPEFVLLDIGLPGIDGYEVARQLRADKSRAVIIAISGYGRPEDRARSLEAGFTHHMVKPLDLKSLQAALE